MFCLWSIFWLSFSISGGLKLHLRQFEFFKEWKNLSLLFILERLTAPPDNRNLWSSNTFVAWKRFINFISFFLLFFLLLILRFRKISLKGIYWFLAIICHFFGFQDYSLSLLIQRVWINIGYFWERLYNWSINHI